MDVFNNYTKFQIENKNFSKGENLFGQKGKKYGKSFYMLLLECLMSWGIIYYNSKFL